jgi:hypothetical protein
MNDLQRTGLLLVLVLVLAWSMHAFAAVEDVPVDVVRHAKSTEIITDTEAHTGAPVVVHGQVTRTDPVVVGITTGGVDGVTVVGVTRLDLQTGDDLYVFGTLTGPDTVTGDRVLRIDPWEHTYTLAVSFVGLLLVAVHVGRHWRFSRTGWAFTPRTGGGRER